MSEIARLFIIPLWEVCLFGTTVLILQQIGNWICQFGLLIDDEANVNSDPTVAGSAPPGKLGFRFLGRLRNFSCDFSKLKEFSKLGVGLRLCPLVFLCRTAMFYGRANRAIWAK